MKITAVRTYIVPAALTLTPWGPGATWVLVKLETDAGIDGWGQAYRFHQREQAVAGEVLRLSRLLDGMDPFAIKRFVTSANDHSRNAEDARETSSAAAGIEIALWDIVGKALGAPVHRLLGGPCRDRIGVYANCWSDVIRSPEELAAFAAQQVESGFRTVKIYPFVYESTADEGIACLRAVRDAVGPEVTIFVDMWHHRMGAEDMPRIYEALHAECVPWFEDPADAAEVEALARIRAHSKLPVVSGETLYSKQQFRRLLEQQAADILNPEISICGILGVKEIAAMAEAYGVTVSVHNNNSMTIGLAAAVQAAAVIPNCTLIEYFPRFAAGSNSFSSFAFELDEDGSIALSPEPGIGVAVDEAAVAPMEYKPRSP